ncbi:NADH-quinone oxidoreductase subunit M [Marinimicrobium agarilyticum]|uniref:NADH-quinone oxidoreductase subunit M n=1 Tax=Marinimicrobium agarilyticum TaxID=306546 RepID=UPI00040D7CC4|nr:NADH-quinone oxidoreductase subunit M [Marinimicrobium agarilyticum]
MILAGLILIPFLGGLLCWQGDRWGEAPRWIALATMVAVLVTALALWAGADFRLADPGAAAWLRELRLPWIPRFGIELHLALDGLSLVLIALTGFLGILAVLCSWKEVQEGIGFFHLNLLFVLGGVVGVFLAVDLFLFFVFWEMMLVPMYFLIALWGHSEPGGKTSTYAAVKFFIYTQASGLLMLAAILALVFAHQAETGELTFSYEALLATTLSNELALLLMLGFFIAFAVKLPVVPLHGWLPDAHAQAPTAGSVDLAGILLKTGAYGLLRFALPLFPEASAQFAPVAMGLGVFGIFYGALLACGQKDIKRLIAYTSISHMGFVLIGIYSGSTLALQGALVLMVAHGLSAAGLFVLSGQLYERLHTRDMTRMGGLWGRLGSLPGFSLGFAVAAVGMPGTANFVGEFMVLFGTFPAAPWIVVLASGGLILSAVYALTLMQKVYFGPAQKSSPLPGLDVREYSMMLGTFALVLLFGLYPQPLLDTTGAVMSNVQRLFEVPAVSSTFNLGGK